MKISKIGVLGVLLLLPAVFMGFSFRGAGKDLLTITESPELVEDTRFPSLQLGEEDGIEDSIMNFAVLRNKIYVLHGESGAPKVGILKIEEKREKATTRLATLDGFPNRKITAASLAVSKSVLCFFESDSRTLIEMEPETRTAASRKTGFSLVSSFGRFRDGMLIVASPNMHTFPIRDFTALEGVSSDVAMRIANEHKTGRVFLMTPTFEVKRTLLGSFNGSSSRESSRGDNFLGRYHVRMSPANDEAAVFSHHLPGIHLMDQTGREAGVIHHPGNGSTVTPGHPLAGMLGVGTRFLYQSDVLVGKEDLLISDLATNHLWQIDKRTREVRSFQLPFPVLRMQADGNYLYLLGMENRLARLLYPSLSR